LPPLRPCAPPRHPRVGADLAVDGR